MHPAPFAYLRVASVAEALAALEDSGDGKLLAGGHSLLPALKLRLGPARHPDRHRARR